MGDVDPSVLMQWSQLNPAKVIRKHDRKVRWCALVVALLPALDIAVRWHYGRLGINPLDVLEKDTGFWALTYLMITLAVTPLRRLLARAMTWLRADYGKRLADWNALIPLRRQFGLTAFFYAVLHVGFYLWLDAGLIWANLLADIGEKPFIVAGLLAFVLLVPLAATSTQRAMRALGSKWRKLHRTVYLIGCAGVIHFIWLAKPGRMLPFAFALMLGVLLGYRLFARFGIVFQRPRDDGMEVAPRKPRLVTTGVTVAVTVAALPDEAGMLNAPEAHGRSHSGTEIHDCARKYASGR